MDPLQEDEYWNGFENSSEDNDPSGENDFEISEVNLGFSSFNIAGIQNVITAGNSAVHYNSSPYGYVLNNPLSYIDPLGLDTGKVKLLKEVNITGSKPQNTNYLDSWLTRSGVYGGALLSAPLPKKWLGAVVLQNSSKSTTALSYTLGKWKKPISFMGKKRLYTHTLNGSKRYASTWGKYLGRWGGKVLGRTALAYSLYDFTKNVALPMAEGMRQYNLSMQRSGNWIGTLPH